MADCCLVPQMYAAQRFGVDPTQYPRLALIVRKLQPHAGVRSTRIPSKQIDAD